MDFQLSVELLCLKVLLVNEDTTSPIFSTTAETFLKRIEPTTPNSSFMSTSPSTSKLPSRANFESRTVYIAFLLLAALILLSFLTRYLRRFAGDAFNVIYPRRRVRRLHHQGSLGSLDPHRSGSSSCCSRNRAQPHFLPVFAYRTDDKFHVECAVCLGEIEAGEPAKFVPYYRHVFHPDCFDRWLSLQITCPVCRSTKFGEVTFETAGE